MGLATSQVRLLALTSRKADVEMQIQLNSKRKTMLTREATDLAKLYYAKLQNAKIQYSTTNGYKDVTYDYLMGSDTAAFFETVVNRDQPQTDIKLSDSMILTDAYGRVILSNDMLNAVLTTLNGEKTPGLPAGEKETVETLTITAISNYLTKLASSGSLTASNINGAYQSLYNGKLFEDSGAFSNADDSPVTLANDSQTGLKVLQYLLRYGVEDGGDVYTTDGSAYYANRDCIGTPITLQDGIFYKARKVNGSKINWLSEVDGSMYINGKFIKTPLTRTAAEQIARIFSYYGSIFSAAFNGTKSFDNDNDGTIGPGDLTVDNFNVAANIYKNAAGDYVYDADDNYAYNSVLNSENLQEGLKSGIYQLVNVSSNVTGGYSNAQGLDYFKTMNYVVEKPDNQSRETITAWYDAARADLSEKESYWDSEITALSSELNAITTEIDSVKKLREDAISSTFKWGNA